MTDRGEKELREAIVAACREMNASGINQGTAGNISLRCGQHMLITPSATPYETTTPDMIAAIRLDDASGAFKGPRPPSTEWRFHQAILNGRPEINAVVHAHPIHATAVAMARKPIPAAHYMVAAFGGNVVPCAGYATYGTAELADLALAALDGYTACLLANHGMIALGETLAKGMWRAIELETLARQYILSLQLGGPVLLGDEEMAATHRGFATYGLRDDDAKTKGAE